MSSQLLEFPNRRNQLREQTQGENIRVLDPTLTHSYGVVKLDRTLTYREHMTALRDKVMVRTVLTRRLAGTSIENVHSCTRVCTSGILCLGHPLWSRSAPTRLVDVSINVAILSCILQTAHLSHHNRVFALYSC